MIKESMTLFFVLLAGCGYGQSIYLKSEKFETINVNISEAVYKGKNCIRLRGTNFNISEMAILKNELFSEGTIEVDVSGSPIPGTDTSFRGFIGIAFRVEQIDTLRYDCFYLRPTNGRANDQLRRNRTTQYISMPGYPWQRLRSETPGKYESYVDVVPGEWIHLKIVINNNKAVLFVNNSNQPCLIVNELKTKLTSGNIALWIGPGTEGYFSNLAISKQS